MASGITTIQWLGLVGPFLLYLLGLGIYYVWEGRRERRLREEYAESTPSEEGTEVTSDG
jgi:hypothetical protein